MIKPLVPVLSLTLLAMLILSACSGPTCEKACGATDGCPSFTGSYSVTLTVTLNECEFDFYSGPATLSLSEVPQDDKTIANITLAQGMGDSFQMTGELCNTSDTVFPKKYSFGAAQNAVVEDAQVGASIGGDLIVYDGGGIEICGALNYFVTEEDDRCASQAVVSTSVDICD